MTLHQSTIASSTWVYGSVGIYGTRNGTGNPVHLPNPNLYPTCELTNLNFRCRVFQLTRLYLTHCNTHTPSHSSQQLTSKLDQYFHLLDNIFGDMEHEAQCRHYEPTHDHQHIQVSAHSYTTGILHEPDTDSHYSKSTFQCRLCTSMVLIKLPQFTLCKLISFQNIYFAIIG